MTGPAAVLFLLFATGFSGAVEFPVSEPGEAGEFELAAWREQVAGLDLEERTRNTPVVHGGWFGADSPEVARNYIIHWGPLGIHVRMHDRSWGGYAGFRAIWPEALLDEAGELLMDCFEVVAVAPGSPADGHLRVGDLLLAMDGAVFRTALELRPDQGLFQYQETRSLEMDAGERFDAAEGRGLVSFDVLRPPAWEEAWRGAEMSAHGGERMVEVEIPVRGLAALRMHIDLAGETNFWCWANLIRPRFHGPAGEIDVSGEEAVTSASTGWGSVGFGTNVGGDPVEVNGRPEERVIGVHARAMVEWAVPEGATLFRASVALGADQAAGLLARVETRERPSQVAGRAVREVFESGELGRGGEVVAELDLPVEPGDELTVALELTRDHAGSCAVHLIEPRFLGGGDEISLVGARRRAQHSGWGSVRDGPAADGSPVVFEGREVEDTIWFHAPGHLTWTVPDGVDRFQATALSSVGAHGQRVVVRRRPASDRLPPALEGMHHRIDIPIQRVGTFVRGFPFEDCEKSAKVAAMTAAWLADIQQEDGSWPRYFGYTHNGYDTAYAGLGLLSTGKEEYLPHIRRAAEYVAFESPQDHWTTPHAMKIIFLSEYWLRTADERILPSLQAMVERAVTGMVAGDWTAGHGFVPGYAGGGVSFGGAHVALALAVASQTPVVVAPGVVDNMLARAQELGPDGFLPYGRGTGTRSFAPNFDGGGTYSGRHGPYLIASLIHGGPRLFTENASAMYERGRVGGIDQGHATLTMSLTWALLAAANVSPEALQRHMEAVRWRLVLLRSWDGGFGQSSHRLEYQGGEGLLPSILRAGAYLTIYNSPKQNLAITGHPGMRARSLREVPPVAHSDAAALGYYQRNWGVVEAVLGGAAPEEVREGVRRLGRMGRSTDTRGELFGFLRAAGPKAAAAVEAMEDLPADERLPLVEMLLGADIRLSVEPAREGNEEVPGRWQVVMGAQHPFAGYFEGASEEERESWRNDLPLPMEGQVTILDSGGAVFAELLIERDSGNHGWQVRTETVEVAGPERGPLDLVARMDYRLGDIRMEYDRAVIGGGEEPGSGEKGRKLLGDRVIEVPGTLERDSNGWSVSFFLPGGTFVAAAGQGSRTPVEQDGRSWVAPDPGVVPAGTEAVFGFSSGWQSFESRVASIRVEGEPLALAPASLAVGGRVFEEGELGWLSDYNRETYREVEFPVAADDPLVAEIGLAGVDSIRGIDLRVNQERHSGHALRLEVEALCAAEEEWRTILYGRPGAVALTFPQVETDRLRLRIWRPEHEPPTLRLEEMRLLRAAKEG